MGREKTFYCDEVCLSDARLEDLLACISSRLERVDPNAKWFVTLDLMPIVELLEKAGLPVAQLETVEAWVKAPRATPEKLRAWVAGEPIKVTP